MAEANTRRHSGKRPASQWYWSDWLRDPALRSISSGARGLWIDILCLMFECVPKGHLQTRTGQPFTVEMICRMTGNISEVEVNRWLEELINSGVASKSATEVIYSRRMVRDEHKRALCAAAGKRGGNPTLKGNLKGQSKGAPKGRAKRNPTPSSSTSVEENGSRRFVPPTIDDVAAYCLERKNGINPQKWIDHYTSNGWMVGRNKMRDWKASVRTWETSGAVPSSAFKPESDLFAGQREFIERRRNGSFGSI